MQHRNETSQDFTTKDVEIISKETVFKGFFQMMKYTFKHRLFAGGWSEPVVRELLERGHAAAVLPYDPIRDEVVLVEQIRVGALEHDHPWQLEIVAGIIDEGETTEEVVRREAVEEAGLTLTSLEKVTSFYPSSGGCSEKLDVFVGQVDSSNAGGVHGIEDENEDIRVHVVSRELAFHWLEQGKFENGASIIALQWLALNRDKLKSQWLK